jgi:hypothetical protein
MLLIRFGFGIRLALPVASVQKPLWLEPAMTRPKNLLAFFLLAVLVCGVAAAVRPLTASRPLQHRPSLTERLTAAFQK